MEQKIFNYFDEAHYAWFMDVYSDALMGAQNPNQFATFIERCLIGNNFIPEQVYRNMRNAIDTNSAVYKKGIFSQGCWAGANIYESVNISKEFNGFLFAINGIHPEIKLYRIDL